MKTYGLAFLFGALPSPPVLPGYEIILERNSFAVAKSGAREFFIGDGGDHWLLRPRLANGRCATAAPPIQIKKASAPSAPLR